MANVLWRDRKISERILLVNIFGIGDVLFTTPIIANLKRINPDIQIGYLSSRRSESFLKKDPRVARVFVYERDELVAIQKKSLWQYVVRMKELIGAIKRENYDWVIDLSLNDLMGFICWQAGIRKRVGFSYKKRGRFLTRKVSLRGFEERHVIEYYLDFLKTLGIEPVERHMSMILTDEDKAWAKKFLADLGARGKRSVIMMPGGGASWGDDGKYRRWDVNNFAKLADKIIEKFNCDIILMGDQSESPLCVQVASVMKHKPFMAGGRSTIHELAAVMSVVDLCVLNDAGQVHIAEAVKARTLSIFGLVDERVYGPYPLDHHVVVTKDIACRPCYRFFRRASCEHVSCLRQILVEDVFRKVETLL